MFFIVRFNAKSDIKPYLWREFNVKVMLVVLEGLDGAGKSTQVRKLRKYLETVCGTVDYIHFPRYDAPVYGNLVSRFLRGDYGDINTVHPQLVALLYAEDRHQAAPGMKRELAEGKTLLLDRYVYSNIAYQCAKMKDEREREELREWILDTEYGHFGLPVPDLNIFLDVPIGFVEKKLTAARFGHDRDYLEGGKDIHEADLGFQKSVRDVYRSQCRMDPRFVRVDCAGEDGGMLPPDDIFMRIKDVTDRALGFQDRQNGITDNRNGE